MANLRMTPEEYSKKLWDWTPLNKCFERGIQVTDIDGMVEAGGKFLFIEGKSIGVPLPKGQRMALDRLARLRDITVVILEGDPQTWAIAGWCVLGQGEYRGDQTAFLDFVRAWFENADRER